MTDEDYIHWMFLCVYTGILGEIYRVGNNMGHSRHVEAFAGQSLRHSLV